MYCVHLDRSYIDNAALSFKRSHNMCDSPSKWSVAPLSPISVRYFSRLNMAPKAPVNRVDAPATWKQAFDGIGAEDGVVPGGDDLVAGSASGEDTSSTERSKKTKTTDKDDAKKTADKDDSKKTADKDAPTPKKTADKTAKVPKKTADKDAKGSPTKTKTAEKAADVSSDEPLSVLMKKPSAADIEAAAEPEESPLMKRPSAVDSDDAEEAEEEEAEEDEPEESPVQKKPAGKAGKQLSVSKKPAMAPSAKKRRIAEAADGKSPVAVKEEKVDEEDFEKNKNGDEKREESKSKKFHFLLEKGELGEGVVAAWEKTKLMKGAGMRAEQSKIINRAIRREGFGKTVVNDDHPYFASKHGKTEVGWSKQWHEGIVFEEACTRLGGADHLRAAVSRGQVKVSGKSTDERYLMYHLPRSSIGGGWEFKASEVLVGARKSADEDARDSFMKEIQTALDSKPDIDSLGLQDTSMLPSDLRGSSSRVDDKACCVFFLMSLFLCIAAIPLSR